MPLYTKEETRLSGDSKSKNNFAPHSPLQLPEMEAPQLFEHHRSNSLAPFSV